MKRFHIFPLLAVVLLITACTKDDAIVDPPPSTAASGVLIVNEGNFQRGNASLSWFDTGSASIRNGIFLSANGRDLGDVGNDVVYHQGNAYVVVNNSDRIEVVSLPGGHSVTTWNLTEGSSPRHLVFDDNGIAYVSCLLRNSVQVIDTDAGTLGPEITVGANPEGMAIAGNRLFVAISGYGGSNVVSVVDLGTYNVISTITVGDYPSAVETTGDGRVAVLCTGSYNDYNDPMDDTPGMLYMIDPLSLAVTDSLTLGGHPMRLSIDRQRGVAYTVDGDIVRVDLAAMNATRFIDGFYYSVLVDEGASRLYVTDPLDYQQAGKFLVFDLQGQKLSEYEAGIIPGSMVVVEQD